MFFLVVFLLLLSFVCFLTMKEEDLKPWEQLVQAPGGNLLSPSTGQEGGEWSWGTVSGCG